MEKLGLRRNLELEVYDIIKSLILDRRFMPGDKISIDRLRADLGVSRTPIVIALKMLEKEMLIDTKPRRGHYVRTFTKKEIIDVLELREALEALGARRAARHITKSQMNELTKFFKDIDIEGDPKALSAYAKEDQGFHEFIMEIAGGEVFSSVFKAYAIVIFTYHADLPGGFVRHPRETIQEHLEMIEAICDRNEDKAERLMRRHMRLGKQKFIKELEKEEQRKAKV
ncbi:MAG: GntR family transcriptional regulator [Desulfobacteraceae bacterium]|jgi:DNA-binding GntR family transcriptional regulator|nr:GntR family transcriptional regulator [Desulfobacteraceae bacterium]